MREEEKEGVRRREHIEDERHRKHENMSKGKIGEEQGRRGDEKKRRREEAKKRRLYEEKNGNKEEGKHRRREEENNKIWDNTTRDEDMNILSDDEDT